MRGRWKIFCFSWGRGGAKILKRLRTTGQKQDTDSDRPRYYQLLFVYSAINVSHLVRKICKPNQNSRHTSRTFGILWPCPKSYRISRTTPIGYVLRAAPISTTLRSRRATLFPILFKYKRTHTHTHINIYTIDWKCKIKRTTSVEIHPDNLYNICFILSFILYFYLKENCYIYLMVILDKKTIICLIIILEKNILEYRLSTSRL